MKHIEIAKESIENFSIDIDGYHNNSDQDNLRTRGAGIVYQKDKEIKASVNINFSKTIGCKVFLGSNIKGDISVFFKGNNSILYIGDDCALNGLQIRSRQANDLIAVGNKVTTTSTNVWISGNGAGDVNPAIIIGDDCMLSYDIVIRNSDGHPIFDLDTDEQLNKPKGIVHIEPHVWIGEQVNILKSVTVGACSILSLGSTVTSDVPRFAVASGIPAKARVKNGTYWARSNNEKAKILAKYFVNKYRC